MLPSSTIRSPGAQPTVIQNPVTTVDSGRMGLRACRHIEKPNDIDHDPYRYEHTPIGNDPVTFAERHITKTDSAAIVATGGLHALRNTAKIMDNSEQLPLLFIGDTNKQVIDFWKMITEAFIQSDTSESFLNKLPSLLRDGIIEDFNEEHDSPYFKVKRKYPDRMTLKYFCAKEKFPPELNAEAYKNIWNLEFLEFHTDDHQKVDCPHNKSADVNEALQQNQQKAIFTLFAFDVMEALIALAQSHPDHTVFLNSQNFLEHNFDHNQQAENNATINGHTKRYDQLVLENNKDRGVTINGLISPNEVKDSRYENHHCKEGECYRYYDLYQYFIDMFEKSEDRFNKIKKIVTENTCLMQQDWLDEKQTFVKYIKAICNELGIESIIAYPSNIEDCIKSFRTWKYDNLSETEITADKERITAQLAQLEKNIQLLQPALIVKTFSTQSGNRCGASKPNAVDYVYPATDTKAQSPLFQHSCLLF